MRKYWICPDGQIIKIKDCIKDGGCRRDTRCLTRRTLQILAKERKKIFWACHECGTRKSRYSENYCEFCHKPMSLVYKPSTTELLRGVRQSYLMITCDYAQDPIEMVFMLRGSNMAAKLDGGEFDGAITEMKLDGKVTGRLDLLEEEGGETILTDNKLSGSFKVAKALGIKVTKNGKEKTIENVDPDMWEWEMQLNHYRVLLKQQGVNVDKMQIEAVVRDGGTWLAKNQGLEREAYIIPIKKIDDEVVLEYFSERAEKLTYALANGETPELCDDRDTWNGKRCENRKYCPVIDFCKLKREEKQ